MMDASVINTNYQDNDVIYDLLAPLLDYLKADNINEVSINRPGEVWIEHSGKVGMKRVEDKRLTHDYLLRSAKIIADDNSQVINAENPILSATLPGNERIEIIIPPACAKGFFVYSIRKKEILDEDLYQLKERGLFDDVVLDDLDNSAFKSKVDDLYHSRNFIDLIALYVQENKNILVTGETSSGKTTTLNGICRLIPEYQRIITIEDTPEISLIQPNHVKLIFTHGEQGKQSASSNNVSAVLRACLRLRPNRIIMQEIRGGNEAFSFLHNLGTGHGGSMTTVHAGSPDETFEQLKRMIHDTGKDYPGIEDEMRNKIDMIVQGYNTSTGQKRISSIYVKELHHGQC